MEGVDVEAIASRRVAATLQGSPIPVRGLVASGDVLARLPPRAAAAVALLAGNVEWLWGLERAVRGFDVAHALELANPLTWQALRARDAGACRRVVATVMENIPFPVEPNRFVAARTRHVATRVDRFVAITERAALHLETAGVPADRIEVLPEGIDMAHFSPDPSPQTRRPGAPLRVLSVARLERAKGVEDLVIAIGLLARREVHAEATLLGTGPLEGRLREVAAAMGVADRVSIPGGVPWHELPAVYRAHDVFVLASAPTVNWREQFGFAIVEAMACGLPVLAGASGSLPEVVGDEAALVRPHDPVHLADRLAELAADEELRRARALTARRRAVESFNVKTVRTRLADLYREVLDTPPRG